MQKKSYSSNKTKKSLGQHWLFDKPTLQTIVDTAGINADEAILEIGPGRGSLTELLAQKAKQVFAIEKDTDLISGLKTIFALQKNVQIIEDDILGFNLTKLPKDYKVVANIPYYLTSALIRTLLESTNPPSSMTLLIQKEVAQSIVAEPGQMSVLAISVQLYARPQIISIVTKDKFHPPPKVDSAIISIVRQNKLTIDVNPAKFMRLVKAGFSQKRKTLRNSLSGGLHISGAEAEALLTSAKIAFTTRAQELSLSQWKNLYDQFVTNYS